MKGKRRMGKGGGGSLCSGANLDVRPNSSIARKRRDVKKIARKRRSSQYTTRRIRRRERWDAIDYDDPSDDGD